MSASRQIWCLERNCFLVRRWLPSCILTWKAERGGRKVSHVSPYKALMPFRRASSSCPSHLLITSLGTRLPHRNFAIDKHSVNGGVSEKYLAMKTFLFHKEHLMGLVIYGGTPFRKCGHRRILVD